MSFGEADRVVRSAADFVVSWTTDGAVRSVKVFEGTSPDAINQPVADVSDDAFVLVTGLDPAQRHYLGCPVEGGYLTPGLFLVRHPAGLLGVRT